MSWHYYHTVWSVMMFSWITNYMVRAGLSPVLIPMMDDLSINYSNAGLIASALFYAYAMMGLPGGFIGDKIGRKMVLVICSFGWGVASLLTGIVDSFIALFVLRFLTGLVQGTYFSNDRPVVAFYTPREKAGLGQGVSFIGLGLGMCLGIFFAGIICEQWGWRWVFIIYAIPSFIASFLIQKIIKEPNVLRAKPSGVSDSLPVKSHLSIAFRSFDLWIIYIAGIPATYGLWMLGAWAPAMFKEIGLAGLSRPSLYASMVGLSAIPGLALSGWVSDKLARKGIGRKTVLSLDFFLAALALCCIGFALYFKASQYILVILIFFAGFFLWGLWAPLFSAISEIAPTEILGTTFGLNCTVNFIGGILSPWLTGILKDNTGSFSSACWLASVLLFLAMILTLLLRPSFRFNRVENKLTCFL
jgi:MFS family permease